MKITKKHFQAIAVFLAGASLSFAEKISFPVKSLVTVEETPVMISAEWNEKWFGENTAVIYNHDLARIAGIFSAVAYEDGDIGQPSNLLFQCYRAAGFPEELIEMHYDLNYSNHVLGNDQASFSFASKKIKGSNSKKNLIAIVIRGTPLNANEWISNLNISDRTGEQEEFHEGFYRTTKIIETELIRYLLKNKTDIEDCCLFITGHSRGAAVANLLAAQLADTGLFDSNYIYTYTFASPNVTTNDEVSHKKYSFIWNIINAEDIVPMVPPNYNNWQYRKYGQTKVLINNWNTDPKKYKENFIPKMNLYFKKFMLRDYHPFMTGPFIPIQCSAILTRLNKDVEGFYNGITALHDKAVSAFWKIFPENANPAESDTSLNGADKTEKQGAIFAAATKWCYKNFDVDVDYLTNCFADMHAMETYLSWIFALDEDSVYSSTGADLFILKGSGDYAVFDSQGKTVATILDGKVDFSKVDVPVAANSFLQGQVVLGLPANRQYTVALSKESLLPNPLKVHVEHFSAEGISTGKSEELTLYPYNSKLYTCSSENINLNLAFSDFAKVGGTKARQIRRDGNLRSVSKFRVMGEVFGSTSGTFNAGIHAGSKNIYGSLLAGHNAAKIGRAYELSTGIGHQGILVSKILIDTEVFANFFYAASEDLKETDERFNLVPSVRVSLSFKPRHRIQFFLAGNMDFHISGFNDAAFDDAYRLMATGQVWTGSPVRIVPNFGIGVRF